MATQVESVHHSLAANLTKISRKEAAIITSVLTEDVAAQTLAESLIEYGDEDALWLARWDKGPLAGEFGLLSGVKDKDTDWPTYLQFRLNCSESYYINNPENPGSVRTGILSVAHDPITAVLTEGITRYRVPYRKLSTYKSIDEETPNGHTRASIITTPGIIPTSWHKEFHIALEAKTIQLKENFQPTTRPLKDLNFPS